MDTQTTPTQTPEEIVLNSTPLPSRLTQGVNSEVNSKFPPKKYLMIAGVVVVLFVLSLGGFILTQPNGNEAESPQVVIKKDPSADEKMSSSSGMTFPTTAPGSTDDPVEELNGMDIGSIEAELQTIQNDAAQLQ